MIRHSSATRARNSRREFRLYKSHGRLSSAFETLESRVMLAVTPSPAPVGSQPAGALNGKIVFTSGGHGFFWDGTKWVTGRVLTNGMVEDLGNQDQIAFYADYLLHAGATVVPMRPVGHQTNEVVIDNLDPGFSTPLGTWGNGSLTPYFSNNGGTGVTYRTQTSSLTETALARFRPNISAAGFYPVYTWVRNNPDRVTDQLYRINYSGGSYEVKVDHQRIGKGWVYLGTYYFAAGTGGNVEISNKSATAGGAIIADAIRFGNGMGDFVPAGGVISGQSREDEESLYWIARSRGYLSAGNLVPSSTYDGGLSSQQDQNVGAPAKWGSYMNDETLGAFIDRIYLGFHSNATDGSGQTRGTLGLYDGKVNPATKTPHQLEWATLIGDGIQNDMLAIGAPPLESSWQNNGANTTLARTDFDFGEIRNDTATHGEFDATIAEVAYHDQSTDANLLRDQKVRDAVGRASYHATIKYFQQFDGLANVTIPEPPKNLRATTDASGHVTIAWDAPTSGGPYGHAPTGYRVETSPNGYGFDGGVSVAGAGTLSLTFSGEPFNAMAYFRVVATNGGGDSLPSNVVAAKPQAGRAAPILIVNNFSRLARTQDEVVSLPINGAGSPSVSVSRVRPRYANTFDYVVQAGDAIEVFNPFLGVDSCSDAAIASGQINLANYTAVIWMSGEQSTIDRTFTTTTQPLVTSYLNGGGRMFISGSEIGWDLVQGAHGSSFFTNTLKANYPLVGGSYNDSDDAGTYNASGAAGSIFAGISLSFDNGTNGTYDVDFPDKILPVAGIIGVSSAMNYVGGTGGSAGIQYISPVGAQKVVFTGFPFESIVGTASQNAVMAAVLNFFAVNSTNTTATPGTPDLTDAKDSGTSTSDNLTNFNNSTAAKALQFTVGGTVSGATVTIYADGNAIGSAVAAGTTTTVTANGSAALPENSHNVTAGQVEPFKLASAMSSGLGVTIDTIAPTISPATFNYLTSQSLSYTFNETIGNSISSSMIEVINRASTFTVPTTASYDAPTRTATFSFPGLLASANYQADFNGFAVFDVAGNHYVGIPTDYFFFQNADANHDRAVNTFDFNALSTNFGQSGRNFSQGDFNYDTIVNSLDFNALATLFNTFLALPSDPVPAPGASLAPLAARGANALGSLFSRDRIGGEDALDSVLL